MVQICILKGFLILRYILIFTFILFNFSVQADHQRISSNDYPKCSVKGLGGNKHSIIRIDSAKSKWGRDNVTEKFIVNGKEKKIILKSKNKILFLTQLNDGVVSNDFECPSILERSFYYKKELLFKSFAVIDGVNFLSQKNFLKKNPDFEYNYPVLESFIYYRPLGKYKPGTEFAQFNQITPKGTNEVMRNLVIALNHYDNLDILKICSQEKCMYALAVTKYKTREKYMVKSSSEHKLIEDQKLIDLVENKFSQLDNSWNKPLRPLFNKDEIKLFVNKIKNLDQTIRIQTNH